jgi:hypothetical protein
MRNPIFIECSQCLFRGVGQLHLGEGDMVELRCRPEAFDAAAVDEQAGPDLAGRLWQAES